MLVFVTLASATKILPAKIAHSGEHNDWQVKLRVKPKFPANVSSQLRVEIDSTENDRYLITASKNETGSYTIVPRDKSLSRPSSILLRINALGFESERRYTDRLFFSKNEGNIATAYTGLDVELRIRALPSIRNAIFLKNSSSNKLEYEINIYNPKEEMDITEVFYSAKFGFCGVQYLNETRYTVVLQATGAPGVVTGNARPEYKNAGSYPVTGDITGTGVSSGGGCYTLNTRWPVGEKIKANGSLAFKFGILGIKQLKASDAKNVQAGITDALINGSKQTCCLARFTFVFNRELTITSDEIDSGVAGCKPGGRR